MLRNLHIENVAVVEEADIEFSDGLNVLTGETGAGKSIVIDSINMALGERVSKDIVRKGAKSASVSALLYLGPSQRERVRRMGVEPDEDGGLLLQREIGADGRGACRANGRMLTVSLLREIGRGLVNIHGQHDSQALLQPESHISYLDEYGGLGPELAQYLEKYELIKDVRAQIRQLEQDCAEKERRLELLRFQIKEIEDAGLRPGEEEELSARRATLLNLEKIRHAVDAGYSLLYDGEPSSACGLIESAAAQLRAVAGFDAALGELCARLEAAALEARDCAHELAAIRSRFEDEQGSLASADDIEERLDLIHRLKRKYGADIPAVLDKLEQLRREAERIELSEERLLELKGLLREEMPKITLLAENLSQRRRRAAQMLEAAIGKELEFLDMPKVAFRAAVEPQKNDRGGYIYTARGVDRVEFLISANPGEDPKPLYKTASGGELSRIMLGIKCVLADQDDVETLIFDEVDSGVSGRAAQKIGLKLRQVSRGKQVICVTHLAQIAALADTHLLIEKKVCGERTRTTVSRLGRAERERELARIIGGVEVTELHRMTAAEMLDMKFDDLSGGCRNGSI